MYGSIQFSDYCLLLGLSFQLMLILWHYWTGGRRDRLVSWWDI